MRYGIVVALLSAAELSGCAYGGRTRLVQAPARCADQTVQVYFQPQSAELTREGRLVIDTAATEVRACRVLAVDVVGLADAAGAPQANLELSRRRAQAVSAALAAAGLPPADFHLQAVGDAGALTPQGEATPLRRRVEVSLRVAPR